MAQMQKQISRIIREFTGDISAFYSPAEARQVVLLLVEEYIGWSRARMHAGYDEVMPPETLVSLAEAVAALKTGKPVQYVLGKAWFNDLVVKVGPGVLIPRPETGEMCVMIGNDAFLKGRPVTILDIGTGSGCIAIDLKNRLPQSEVSALDISPKALEIAAVNADKCNAAITFIQTDILVRTNWANFPRFDLIVSNPPYIKSCESALMRINVLGFEPMEALFVPDDDPLIFYSAISDFALMHLNKPGKLWFEINEKLGQEVCNLLKNKGFVEIILHRDMNDRDRFVSATLC